MDTEKNDVQCSTSEEYVKCRVNIGGQERLFVGKKHQSLKDAMAGIQKYHSTFSTTNHILFAEVKGRHGKVVVPPTLLCGWLKENTLIELEKISESKKNGSSMVGHQTNLPKFDQQTIFFVKMDDRKNRPSITTISYEDYKCKELCVIANDGDTFLEAMEKDGRFTNPEKFQLQNEKGSTHDIDLQAKLFPNEVFSVKRLGNRKRNADSRDSKAESKRIALGDCTNTASGGIESDGVIIKKEPDDNIPTSSSESVTEDMYQVVVRKVKSMAYELFLGPSKAKNEKTRDKAICNFVKKQFSKKIDQSKPALLIERIASATKLVGRIFCGATTATCFLVREDIVMTNFHVYEDIVKEMQNPAIPEEHRNPTVLFNHKYPHQLTDLVKVEVQIDAVIAYSPVPQLDYVLLRLREHNHQVLRDQVELFNEVFKNVAGDQVDGLVTIIGHPGGQRKAVDTDCRIISEYLWRNQVHKRVQKNVGPDSYFYLSQKIKEEITSDGDEHKFAYDTSFFEGASGSPVINDQGLVIAMHSCGYKVYEMDPNAISVMEFGVSIAAIFNDLHQKNPSLATELFPHYHEQPMDVEP